MSPPQKTRFARFSPQGAKKHSGRPFVFLESCGLRLEALRIEIDADGKRLIPVDDVSLHVARNECLALLGESGCGKSLTALALMRLLPEGARIAAGRLDLNGHDLFNLPESAMRRVRGGQLAMIFQEPMTSLNPVMTVGEQIGEALRAHRPCAAAEEQARTRAALQAVGLPPERCDSYPFQLSGGQRQRALIAMMLAGEPEVLIADEPTTALDVTVQAQILTLLKDLQRTRGMGLVLITHDLDVASDMADRVAVMYAGQIVEHAPRNALYAAPAHPYTQKLFAVLPRLKRRGERLDSLPGHVPPPDASLRGCRFAERCPRVEARCRDDAPALREIAPGHTVRCHFADEPTRRVEARPTVKTGSGRIDPPAPPAAVLDIRDLAVHFPIRRGLFKRTVDHFRAVDGVSLDIAAGETLALVGESGCGKTTLARAVLRLIAPSRGEVRIAGENLAALHGEALRRKRRDMQIVFQDPFSSLNPRLRIGEILEEGMRALLPELDDLARRERARSLRERVGLPADALRRYPHEFSGGQRQRIAIARALAVAPKLLILDEPTSALDVSVQAQILNLLADIQAELGLAYLFITHNLPVVGYLAQRVAVMQAGQIVETGEAAQVLTQPQNAYTRQLLAAAPGAARLCT